MKRTQVLATLALAFMLGVAVPTTALTTINNAQAYAQEAEAGSGNIWLARNTVTQATTTDTSAPADAAHVTTMDELSAKLSDNSVSYIILDNDLRGQAGYAVMERETPVTLDLNTHTINTSKTTIYALRGNLTIVNGTLDAVGGDCIAVYGSNNAEDTNYTTVTVDTSVTMHSFLGYAVAIYPYDTDQKQYNAYGVKVVMNGNIQTLGYGLYVNGYIQHAQNRPQIYIGDTANINVWDQEDSTPIYAAGTADWYIGAATLKGKAGLGIKAGSFRFNGTTVVTDGKEVDPSLNNNGIDGTSVVFQIEHNTAYADDISITINGGSYTTNNSNVFYEYGNATNKTADIKIVDGTFSAGTGKTIFGGDISNRNVSISGGTFSGSDLSQLQSYLAAGLIIDSDGKVVAAPIVDSTVTDHTDNVSVTGKFAQSGLALEAAALDEEGYGKDLFGDRQFVAYQLTIYDADNQKLTDLPTGMQISIKVPANFSGTRSNIYRISDDNKTATKVDSIYKNGALVFSSDTLGRFAVVEEADISSGDSSNTGGSSSSTTITNATGDITISGNFAAGKYTVKAEASDRKITAFGLAKYALYDINLLNSAGVKVNPDGAVVVSIKVPEEIDGSKSSIYYVTDEGQVEKLKSTYANGIISFTTTHFSLYAIVEDGGPNAGSIVSTPETGALAHQGIISAVSSMMPVLAVAGVMFALFGRKLIIRRRAEAMAGVECEIVADAKAIIEEVESEPQIERFVATPMTAADEEEIKARIFGADQK